MTELQTIALAEPSLEVERVRRVPGRDTVLRISLRAGSDTRDVTIQRALNPALFDFMAKHAG